MTAFADLGLSDSTLQALQDVGYEAAQPDPGASDPADARGSRRHRPGTDGVRQDGRLRPADHRVRRSDRARGAGARPHADARALHPGHAGDPRVRQPQGRRRRRRLRRRADPHPAGPAEGRRAHRRRHGRPRARPHQPPLARARRMPLRRARRGRRDARPRLPRGRREDPAPDAEQPPDGAVQRDDAAADPRARRQLPLRPRAREGSVRDAHRRLGRAVPGRRSRRPTRPTSSSRCSRPSGPTRRSSSRARRSAPTSSTRR